MRIQHVNRYSQQTKARRGGFDMAPWHRAPCHALASVHSQDFYLAGPRSETDAPAQHRDSFTHSRYSAS